MICKKSSPAVILSAKTKNLFTVNQFFIILLFVQYMCAILDIDFKITNNTWDARIRYTANR